MSKGLFSIGDVVEANKDIDYGVHGFAKQGERFVVIDYVLSVDNYVNIYLHNKDKNIFEMVIYLIVYW